MNSLMNSFLKFAHILADHSGSAILPFFRIPTSVEDKGGRRYDPVTSADFTAERVMRDLIRSTYPTHNILGEEEGNFVGDDSYTWVLDPIDGTRSFIVGLPLWGTLIALNDGVKPIIGIMNQPYTGERFVGTQDGSWLNGVPIFTRRCKDISTARLMCTTPDMFENELQLAAFNTIAKNAQLVRFSGDCYAYCMLAMGFVDIVIESGLKPYDIQALIPIIKGAGGVITTWDGKDPQNGGAIVACGDPQLHELILSKLADFV